MPSLFTTTHACKMIMTIFVGVDAKWPSGPLLTLVRAPTHQPIRLPRIRAFDSCSGLSFRRTTELDPSFSSGFASCACSLPYQISFQIPLLPVRIRRRSQKNDSLHLNVRPSAGAKWSTIKDAKVYDLPATDVANASWGQRFAR